MTTRVRRMLMATAILIALVWAGPWCYRFIKSRTAEEFAVTDVPASRKIRLAAGKACIVRLPGGKTVALWCTKARGFEAAFNESDLAFHYGETPFKTLEREDIVLPNGNTTTGEYLSYIRQGSVMDGGRTREYFLYVDQYCLSIRTGSDDGTPESLPLVVAVRLATEKEMILPSREREHYLEALQSGDPKIRREAINELGEMISLGSDDAGDPVEISNAIRPLLKDADADVRKEAQLTLRGIGDDEAVLEMLTPRPIPEFAEPNGAWTVAGWCQHSSEKVPRHVMTYFDTDDPKLHEFALAFFSVYKMDYVAVQPYVARYLKSETPEVRAAAASAIPFTCDRNTAASLLSEALGDASEKVLVEALTEASRFNDSIPVQRVLPLLSHGNPEVREKAAYALDGCQNPAAVAPLLAATRDENARVRAQAAVILGRIGDDKAYPRLLEMLKDQNADVRESAINGLRWLGRGEAIEAIAPLADRDPDDGVRQMAKRTVRELRGK